MGWIVSGVIGVIVGIIAANAHREAKEAKEAVHALERSHRSRWLVSLTVGTATTVAVEVVRVYVLGGASLF